MANSLDDKYAGDLSAPRGPYRSNPETPMVPWQARAELEFLKANGGPTDAVGKNEMAELEAQAAAAPDPRFMPKSPNFVAAALRNARHGDSP